MAEGVMNAGVFAHGGANTEYPYNIHVFFLLPRIAVGILISAHYLSLGTSIVALVGVIVGLGLLFPFFHDGAYYQTRRYLDNRDYHWFAKSKTTTAKISLGAVDRTALAAIGIALYYLSV